MKQPLSLAGPEWYGYETFTLPPDQVVKKTGSAPAKPAYIDLPPDYLRSTPGYVSGTDSGNGAPAAYFPEGMPLGFAVGQPVDYRRPAVDARLNEAAASERPSARADIDAATAGVFGVPADLGRDYHGELLNRGMNESRGSFVNASDAQRQSDSATPFMRGAFGDEPGAASVPAELSPNQKADQRAHAAEYAANMALSLNPYTAIPMAGYNIGSGAADLERNVNEGRTRDAAINGAGILANLLFAGVPAAGLARETGPAMREAATDAQILRQMREPPAQQALQPGQLDRIAQEILASRGNGAAEAAGVTEAAKSPFKVGDTIQLKDKEGISLLAKPSRITDIQHDPQHGTYVQVEGSKSYYPMEGAVKAEGAASPLSTMGMFVGVPPGPLRDLAFGLKGSGAANREIFDKTGYAFGPEGAIKREISDAGATIKPENIKPGFVGTYGDLVDHPEAYAAVPGLKERPVTVTTGDMRSNGNGAGALFNAAGKNQDPAAAREDLLGLMQYDASRLNNFAGGSGYTGGAGQVSTALSRLEQLQNQMARDGASKEARDAVSNYRQYLEGVRADYVRGLVTGDPAKSELLSSAGYTRQQTPQSNHLQQKLDKGIYNNSAGGYEKRIAKQRLDKTQEELGYPFALGQLRNEPDFGKMVVMPTNDAVRSPIDLLNFAINWDKYRGTR